MFCIKKKLLHELKQNALSIVSCNKANLFKQIRQLQDHFVITYVDKSPNYYAAINYTIIINFLIP